MATDIESDTDTPGESEPHPGEAFLLAAFEPEHRRDPYPLYASTRAATPVLDAGNHLWVTFGHRAANGLLRARGTSSNERQSTYYRENIETDERLQQLADREQSMPFLDPPDHTRLRGLVNTAFTARTVERLVPRMQAMTDELLDRLAEAGSGGAKVDLVAALAYPLPVAVICELLGVPATEHERFGAWSQALTRSLDPSILRSEEDDRAALAAEDELQTYIVDLLVRRRAEPGDDLLSALLAARDGGDSLSEAELVTMVVLLLVAGHETTVNLIGNGAVALLRNRSELERWRGSGPSMDRSAVDELLRYDSPVQMAMRVVLEDTELDGVTVPARNQVLMLLGSANRDPEVFDDPDRLDLSRRNAPRHLSFGGGIHHCLGMALARLEGQIALGSLIRRFPDLELAGEPELRDRFVLRGYHHIPVTSSR